ncbi:LacI family DNA-binding transcriptional regulator [Janthinobacterium sp.]|uniref:LacI family DNA-binding transcriptional regulator n=1 Tax=Janthinobacterium sp. TaxID=1871054 RepID=UPI00293D1DE4|nr:LacI family DNA-binding transcriptional regulator [Janthinobacterium sp.]
MATMKQVAERAGVSTTTVSHVINNTRVVSADVRARVLGVIQQMRYVPSAVARSLKNDRTHTIGMMVPNNSNPYFAEVIRGIEDAAFKQGYNVILCNSYDDPGKQVAYIRVLMEKRIDGLILVASGSDAELTRFLAGDRLPTVLVDREIGGVAADFIEADHELGAYLGAKYLLELGHRAIACVAGPEKLLPSRDRVAGYRRALDEAGVAPRAEWLIYSDFTSAGGYRAFQQLLALAEPPSAICAGNDLMAIGGICAASEAGVRIPGQLSVLGYDDIAPAAYSNPPLSTISQPTREMGALTARILIERMLNPELPLRRELLQPSLVVRKSTAPFAG